jgi:hypothetical protein
MMSRRRFLLLPPLGIIGWTAPGRSSPRVQAMGCYLKTPTSALGLTNRLVASVDAEQRLITSSGDVNLDRYLGRALVRLAKLFEVYPDFGFFDDRDHENALAVRDTKTVLFGLQLFHHTLKDFDDGGMAVIAVCAHEFAHIYQYESGYHAKLTSKPWTNVKLAELHADYLAGYFLAARKAVFPTLNLQGAGALFEKLGDTEFTAREHHGTPEQRLGSIEAGFNFGRNAPHDVGSAAEAGERFVVLHYS